MKSSEILDHLARNQAVLTGYHFVYASGFHGPAYIDIRQVGHQVGFLQQLGVDLARKLAPYSPDIIIGPETLGRTLATQTGNGLDGVIAIWCEIVEISPGSKRILHPRRDRSR